MSDYKTVLSGLETLHRDACLVEGYSVASGATLIYVGEYELALDEVATAYTMSNKRMRDDRFQVFEELSEMMDMASDPEYQSVAELRKRQNTWASCKVDQDCYV